jgi:hypothetical protein
MRGLVAVAAAAASVSLLAASAIGWATPRAQVAGNCSAGFSIQIVDGDDLSYDADEGPPTPQPCDPLPQILRAGDNPVRITFNADAFANQSGDVLWDESGGHTLRGVLVQWQDGEVSCWPQSDDYGCNVGANNAITYGSNVSDAVAPRVRAELLTAAPVEHVAARGRLPILVRTSEPGSVRVSLVAAAGGSRLGTGRVKARYGGERLLVSVRLRAAGRRALARARGLARYRLVIRAVDRAGNARRVRVRAG